MNAGIAKLASEQTNGSGGGAEPFVGDQTVSLMVFESRDSLTKERTLPGSVNVRNPPKSDINSASCLTRRMLRLLSEEGCSSICRGGPLLLCYRGRDQR